MDDHTLSACLSGGLQMSEDYAFDTKITLDAHHNPQMEASFAVQLLWALQEKLGFL